MGFPAPQRQSIYSHGNKQCHLWFSAVQQGGKKYFGKELIWTSALGERKEEKRKATRPSPGAGVDTVRPAMNLNGCSSASWIRPEAGAERYCLRFQRFQRLPRKWRQQEQELL